MRPAITVTSPNSGFALRLRSDGTAVETVDGSERYPVEDGVIRFTANSEFYEGAYMTRVAYVPKEDSGLYSLPLWLINSGYLWTVRKHISAGSVVAEFGGGAGVAYFASRYNMAGFEVSFSALRAMEGYDVRIQCDARQRLPVADNTFDGVVSSYFWEHFTSAEKRTMAKEFFRVLKPGGKIVFLYDLATQNPLISWKRRQRPDLYSEVFLNGDGHVGYETLEENEESLKQSGFRLLEHLPMERTPVLSPSVFEKFSRWPGIGRRFWKALYRMQSKRIPLYGYSALIRASDRTWGRMLPRSWARTSIIVCQKPAGLSGSPLLSPKQVSGPV